MCALINCYSGNLLKSPFINIIEETFYGYVDKCNSGIFLSVR